MDRASRYIEEGVIAGVTLLKCPECQGSGEEECCGGHMCPGTTKCSRCGGKGAVLNDEDKTLAKRTAFILNFK